MDMKYLSQRASGNAELFLRKHGASILTAAGASGFVVSNFMWAKAALRSSGTISKLKYMSTEIQDKEIDANYTVRDKYNEMGLLWMKEVPSILKEFGPAIAVSSVSVACVIFSHKLMRDKQAALGAAYFAIARAYESYRERVREELGKEKELEIYRHVRTIPKDPESEGFDPNVPCDIDYGYNMASRYAKFFDESNINWVKTPEYNLIFIRQKQNWLNDRLRMKGFVFLNEAYDELGLPWTQEGQVVGWRHDAAERGTGDGFIDFGLYNQSDEVQRAFINGVEPSVLLDFNVDGPISIP